MRYEQYVPQGMASWSAYYRRQDRIARVKQFVWGTLGALALVGAYALNGYIDFLLGG